jgi:hypothetical protein
MKLTYNSESLFKRLLNIFLVIILVFSSISGYATNGDIIHIGRQQLFSADSLTQAEDILKAIEAGADPNGFYKVVETDNERKYINIAKTEEEQMKYLVEQLSKAGIDLTDSDAIIDYVKKNPSLGTKLKEVEASNTYEFENIPNIGNQIEANYYGGNLYPSLVEGKNYSIPEPGSQDNTTKIKELELPVGSYEWKIKLTEVEENTIPFNKELKETEGYKKYTKDTDIKVENGKYLGLYAVNTESKVKAFISIELKSEMIKKSREMAEDLSEGELKAIKAEKIENIANAVKITGIPSDENAEYKAMLEDSKIKVYKDLEIKNILSDMNNIKLGDAQVPNDFVKYIYVLKLSKDEKPNILGYKEIEITKDDINHPTQELSKEKYIGPVKGTAEGSTKFTKLDGSFKYIIADKVDIPIKDADYSAKGYAITENTNIKPTGEQKTLIGKELLLLSLDDNNKVRAHAKFNLTKENVAGQKAQILIEKAEGTAVYNYTLPTKGLAEGTTKIEELKLENIDNATKFMYEILKEEIVPEIDDIREKAVELKANQDIKVSENDYLLLLATDDEGKIKAYGSEKLKVTMIKNSEAGKLEFSVNYSMPERGIEVGTTRFEHLKYGDAEFYYILSPGEIEILEGGSDIPSEYKKIEFTTGTKTEDIEIYPKEDTKLKDENGFTLNMVVYAVKDDKALAYEKFTINQDNVKLPGADPLPEENYGSLSPGSTESSTQIDKLNKKGLSSSLQYYYKFVPNSITIGINEKVKDIKLLEAGKDLRTAKAGEHLLILLVDSQQRTKYYKTIELKDNNIRGSNAAILKTPQHYSEPIAGSENGSTKFEHIGFGVGQDLVEGATKFMVKISDKPFGKIEIDKQVEGAADYTKNNNITGVDISTNKYLLLLATDDAGNVKAYKEFTLNKNNIRGGDASPILAENYTLAIGEKPSTTRFTKLEKHGFSPNITWLYKWSQDGKFSPENPYLNQIVDTKEFKSISINQDMEVNKLESVIDEPKYGYILLYAVLNGREVQGYKAIPVNTAVVKEHAEELNNISLSKEDTNTDHTKVKIIGEGNYKYIITQASLGKPARDAAILSVAKDAKDIINGQELLVSIGQYLTIYKVEDNKIKGYNEFIISSENVKQGSAEFVGLTDGIIEIPEGNLNNGLYEIKIKLTGATWSDNLYSVESVRNALFDGFKVDKEKENWDKVVARLKATGRHGLRIDGETLTITTTRTDDYDIVDEQRITLTIPAIALKDANNPIKVTGTIVVRPTVGATVSGSIMTNNRQKDINSGETTIIVKLKDGSFKSWDDANKQKLIDGFIGTLGDTGIWKSVRNNIKPTNVVPQSPQEVKITIPANTVGFGTQSETITLTIPWDIITDGKENENIMATPRFEIRPDILRVEGNITGAVEVEAPLYKNILPEKNKWTIDITVGTLKDDLSIKDVEISGLGGLKVAAVNRLSDKQLEIVLSGTSTTPIPEEGKELEITIKGTAIKEANSLDSKPIFGKITRQDSIIDKLQAVTINVKENKLEGFDEATMQYSLNSKNGTDGDWSTDITKIGEIKPGKVYVRSQDNKKVFHLVAELKSASAPTGVKIGEINYTAKTIEINGLDTNKNYDYSADGGLTWTEEFNNPITLTDNINDIRVRLSSTTEQLYSLPTSPLKFLDLSKVEMNVAAKEISNTLSGMQYKFGVNGATKATTAGVTRSVLFEPGELIVFEKTNPNNSRVVGEVKITSMPDKADLTFNIGEGKVTGDNLEFTITTLTQDKYNTIKDAEWMQSPNDKVAFKAGTLIFRKKATEDTLPSEIVAKDEIIAPAEDAPAAPKLKVDNYTKEIKYDGKSLGENDCLLEYRIAPSKEWQSSTEWTNDKEKIKDQDVTVYVRVKAEEHKLPSKEASINLTANINLDSVSLNLAEGLLENTTSRMEYSFNSTDGLDGDWRLASNGKTNIIAIDKLHELEGKTIYIRQNKNEKQNRAIVSLIERNALVAKDDIKLNYKDKTITNESTNDIEIKLGNGNWITVVKDKPLINVNFVSGQDIIYRAKATKDKIYSDSALKEMVPYPGATPYVDYNDETNKIEIVGENDAASGITAGYEFKEKTSENWLGVIAGNLADRVFNGDVVVQIRKSATETEVASSIREITFTKNLDFNKVGFDKYGTPPQILNTETEMEYQIFFKNQEPPKEWKKAVKGNTPLNEIKNIGDVLLILIRDSRTKFSEKVVYGEEKDRPIDLDSVKYQINSNGISFTGIKNTMEYKKATDSSWTIGSDNALSNLPLEPIEIAIRDKNYPTKTRTIKVDARANTPNIQVEKFDYKSDGTIDMILSGFDKSTMEYSIDGGVNYWDFSNNTSIFNIDKNHKVFIRAKAIFTDEIKNEAGKLPSLPTAQLNGIYLGEIGLNPMERKIEGTSGLMEYSLNSTDGKDGTWTKAISPDTTTPNFTTGMTVWIREIAKPLNARVLSPKIERETKPDSKDIIYDILKGTIENTTDRSLKYRISGGTWIELPAKDTASSVVFKPGDFHILAKGTLNKLDSDPVLVTTIKAEASAPKVEYDDITNKVTKINDLTDFSTFEYKLPNSNYWIDGKFLAGEEFVGDVIVQIRIKAIAEELPSQIKEVKFNGLDLRKVRLSTYIDTYELNGTTTDMEFRVTIGVEEKQWIKCTDTNTQLYYMDTDGETKVYINSSNEAAKIEIRKAGNVDEKQFVIVYPTTP